MAKGGIAKLGKLKCMLKRWQHAAANSKVTRHHHLGSDDDDQHTPTSSWDDGSPVAPPDTTQISSERLRDDGDNRSVPPGMREVYVGKSRRRYLVGAQLLDHPLFQILLQRSAGTEEADANEGGEMVVGCEVVMFEHLLWMLENGGGGQPESIEELVDFYYSDDC